MHELWLSTNIARSALILIAGECVELVDAVSVHEGTGVMLRNSAANNALSKNGANCC